MHRPGIVLSRRSNKRRAPRHGVILLCTLLAACTGNDTDAPQPPADANQDEPTLLPAAPPRVEKRQDTIWVEGMPQVIAIELYESPAGFPVPFSTYVPQNMAAEPVRSGEADAVRFIAVFGGQRNDEAFLQVTVHPAGTTEAEARERTRAAAGEGIEASAPADEEPYYDWSIIEHRFIQRVAQGGIRLGHASLGRHGDHFFTVLMRYPGDYADGFGPRADRILETWRWEDTGTGLGN